MGDEFHFLLRCSKLCDIRNKLIPKYYRTHTSMFKFIELVKCENVQLSIKLGKFIKEGFVHL